MSLLAALLSAALAAGAAETASKPAEYSFWLVASGKEQAALRKKVAELAKKLGTPAFEPHVTLIGLGVLPEQTDASMTKEGEALAKSLEAVPVRFALLEWQDKFFRCFYYKAAFEGPLMAAGELGRYLHRRLTGREPGDPSYYPHLSLVYADMPAARKEKLVEEEFGGKREQDVRVTLDRLELWDSSASPDKWRRVASWELSAK